jgi:hypothetical protein
MKTNDELENFAELCYMASDERGSYKFTQDETGTITATLDLYHGPQVLKIYPWGTTLDGQELWKYGEDDGDDKAPVGTWNVSILVGCLR